MVDCGRLNPRQGDDIKNEYASFTSDPEVKDELMKFNKEENRLDELYYEVAGSREKYAKLWGVVKTLLLLSHGQASVERGFSVNKLVSVVNLSEHNLIARRLIKDHIAHVGGVLNVVLSKELLSCVQSSRLAWQMQKDKEKEENKKKQNDQKRERLEDELQVLRKRKKTVEEEISNFNFSADKLSEDGQKARSWDYIDLAARRRESAREKQQELEVVKGVIKKKETEFKQC